MKKIHLISKFLIAPVFMLLAFSACEDEDAVTVGIEDVGHYIEGVDKEVAEPGDVITMTGSNLDKVYKVMLNTNNAVVRFEASENELKINVPSNAPLGDVITFNIFFEGKGLAQRAINLQSPPVIQGLSPAAGQPGTQITVLGRELYLATEVYLGEDQVDFEIVDDRTMTIEMPDGSTGGPIKIISETGSESLSPFDFQLGQELMVNNFDGRHDYMDAENWSANGNLDEPVIESGDFIQGNFAMLNIVDEGTSWGGNFDLFLNDLPEEDISNISLSIDVKASTNLVTSIMVATPQSTDGGVSGQHHEFTTDWQTITIPLTEMQDGYGTNGDYFDYDFSSITGVKVQPPATENFGESISIDNVKFIISE